MFMYTGYSKLVRVYRAEYRLRTKRTPLFGHTYFPFRKFGAEWKKRQSAAFMKISTGMYF